MGPGLLVVLSAPSGAGKTTLAHLLLKEHGDGAHFSVSTTTRMPRGQERDGVDYRFVTAAEFQGAIDRGELLEWAEVHGRRYGSHIATLEEARRGRIVVYDIDVQGGNAIKRSHPEAVTVFVLPPSMPELERRLRGRATDSDEVVQTRLGAAREEIARGLSSYDFVVVNDRLERAFEDLSAIVRAERRRRGRGALSVEGPWMP